MPLYCETNPFIVLLTLDPHLSIYIFAKTKSLEKEENKADE